MNKELPQSFLVKEEKIKKVLEVLSQYEVVFKGGTSLSLSHGIIKRFSEDIDVSFYLEDKNDTKINRKNIKEEIVADLKKLDWIETIELNGTDILISFQNNAEVSKLNSVIRPNTIKLELQDPERKRHKPISSNIAPFEGAHFTMNVANSFSTYTDKVALLVELTYSNEIGILIDKAKTMPRHMYDYLAIYEHLDAGRAISSQKKYVEYCNKRIDINVVKNVEGKIVPRTKYDNIFWSKNILKQKSMFPIFASFLKMHKETIIEIINSIVHPGASKFSIAKFLKAIESNFKYYEGLMFAKLNKN
ncbi:nucleotidyl transferase AbiEii/AbiGii toxin family protein [Mycoplasma marinum]|uniref:nucleotidyl transferase AbiEii/AbiGii toxin family protein n=1 Tax=Mycoplasma marinum TaxID=1937190 RepID=UPI003B349DF1